MGYYVVSEYDTNIKETDKKGDLIDLDMIRYEKKEDLIKYVLDILKEDVQHANSELRSPAQQTKELEIWRDLRNTAMEEFEKQK